MQFNRERRNRRSIRLREYDYTQPGAYFVTICTQGRECLLGEIVDGKMRVNQYGREVGRCWEWLDRQYAHVELDQWVIMPNHLHGVVVINDMGRGGSRTAPTMDIAGPKPLGRLIGAFKTVSTKQINALRGTPGSTLWQRNYYEHVICGEAELDRVRRYVKDNPLMWDMDQENPGRQAGGERESWQV